jgi:hypothetical protein
LSRAAATGAAFSADVALAGFAACAAGRFLLAEAGFCLDFMSTEGFGGRLSIPYLLAATGQLKGRQSKAGNSMGPLRKYQILFHPLRAARAANFVISL